MDTTRRSESATGIIQKDRSAAPKRQRWTVEEKRRIVEETMAEGASVARVARAHGVNANQVFGWRRLYRSGRLGGRAVKLLPVSVSENPPPAMTSLSSERSVSDSSERSASMSLPGTIQIKLRRAQVRIEGNADPALLRVVMEWLRQ